MSEEKITYEVWGFSGQGSPALVSDNPLEIVEFLRSFPVAQRHFNVHPLNQYFHNGKLISHDFISKHSRAMAEELVKRAFEAGKPEGLAEELRNLYFGR